eukprot:IDg5868t1
MYMVNENVGADLTLRDAIAFCYIGVVRAVSRVLVVGQSQYAVRDCPAILAALGFASISRELRLSRNYEHLRPNPLMKTTAVIFHFLKSQLTANAGFNGFDRA